MAVGLVREYYTAKIIYKSAKKMRAGEQIDDEKFVIAAGKPDMREIHLSKRVGDVMSATSIR